LFLLPLWQAIGRSRGVVAVRNLPWTVAAIGGVAAVAGALAFVPADFDVEARGTLQPVVRRDVFVREAGVVTKVSVDHAQRVTKDQELVQIRSRDLEVSIADLAGRKSSTEEQIAALRRARAESRQTFDDQNRMAGQVQQLEKSLDSLALQLDLLLKKQKQLVLHSPIDGQVVTWDVKNLLEERPVEKGQILMSVADPKGDWQLELHLREDRAGYVARAWNESQAAQAKLGADYILATAPGHRLQGVVTQIDSTADVRGDEGNTVLVKVAIDRTAIDESELRPGASASAKIHCGRRSLGFVWFHELVAAIRSKVLFRL
jgi:multidrug efflux pump subunit AcrA (membrane-fusion protein)